MFGKVKQILIFITISTILSASIFLLSSVFDYEEIYKNANVWYKVSTDSLNPGEVVALDMSKGYATSDEGMIYIVVYLLNTDEEVIVALPNGGYWTAPKVDTTSMEIQKAFGKLEQDLKN